MIKCPERKLTKNRRNQKLQNISHLHNMIPITLSREVNYKDFFRLCTLSQHHFLTPNFRPQKGLTM